MTKKLIWESELIFSGNPLIEMRDGELMWIDICALKHKICIDTSNTALGWVAHILKDGRWIKAVRGPDGVHGFESEEEAIVAAKSEI